jgi:hypothetical protein
MLYGFRRTMPERRRAEESRRDQTRSTEELRSSERPVGAGSSETRPSEARAVESRVSGSRSSTAKSTATGTHVAKTPIIKQTPTRQVQSDLADPDPGENQSSRHVLVNEDEVWIQYGTSGASDWPARCVECREAVSSWKNPVAQCVNCWKVEVWGSSDVIPHQMDWLDLGEVAETVARQTDAVIKVSKLPIHVVRTGVPRDGYPGTDFDYLLMAYAENISEREELRHSLCLALGMEPAKAEQIPVRRGCWLYDEMLGPWTEWYPMDRDMGEELEA